MLAKTGGNMDEVYREFWRMQEIADHAERVMNRASNAPAVEAEIGDSTLADWYLVKTFPGDDVRAMRWLARRRFGIFRPMQQRTDKRNDAKLQGWEPVFPGWLFVYTWDIAKHHGRICACPGVLDILCDPVSFAPVPVNQPDKDGVRFVDKLRSLSWVYEEHAPKLQRHQPSEWKTPSHVAKSPRRPSKCERKTLDKLKKALKSQGRWDASTWDCANALEPHMRIALMQRYVMNSPAVPGCL